MPVSPDLGEAFTRQVIEVYAETERIMLESIRKRLERGIDSPSWYADKLAQVSALRKELESKLAGAQGAAAAAVEDGITRAYAAGVQAAQNEVLELGMTSAFAGTSRAAVEAIVRETTGLLGSTQFAILRQATDVYRETVEGAAAQVAAGGLTRREASQRVLAGFASKGISGFTDRAGRRWSLEAYAEMTMRTASGRAAVEGSLERYRALGPEGDLVIVSDSPEECPLCRPWEGRVLSQSGTSRQHPPLSAAIISGLFHPNCTHSLGLFVPGLTRPMKGTENPRGYEERQRQRHLERKVREWKRREAAAMTPDARRAATMRRRRWEDRLSAHVARHDRKRLRYRETPFRGTGPGAPTVRAVTPPVSMGPRGEVLDGVFRGLNFGAGGTLRTGADEAWGIFSRAARALDAALYDLDPKVRDLFAGAASRLQRLTFSGASSAGRKNAITTLGSTKAAGIRDASRRLGISIRPDTTMLELEFRRSALYDDLTVWNRKAKVILDRDGRDSLRAWAKTNPPPDMAVLRWATDDEIAETLLHEMTHVLDFLSDVRLREKFDADLTARIRGIYAGGNGDGAFWYAASDPAEGLAEIVEMYVYGTRIDGKAVLTGEAWRAKYPDLAEWVEKNVFGLGGTP